MAVAERAPVSVQEGAGAAGEIIRDIARGGLVGLVVGVVVASFGGRVVMRIAALAVPTATGAFTENGNAIGTISFDGTIGLVVFGGLVFGLAAGVVWVAISPWIPGTGLRRALLTMPIAIGLAGFFLVDGGNSDFIVLRHDPVVVGLLLALVALVGFAIAWGDGLLDRRLPPSGDGPSPATLAYALLTAVGLVFLPLVMSIYFSEAGSTPVAIALLATGSVTVVWWALRLRGHREPPRAVVVAGRVTLLAAVAIGFVVLVPELAEALGAA